MACTHYSFTRSLVRDTVRTFVLNAAAMSGVVTGMIIVAPSVQKARQKLKAFQDQGCSDRLEKNESDGEKPIKKEENQG